MHQAGLFFLILVWIGSNYISAHAEKAEINRGLNDLKITLDRGYCYGSCPSYVVEIHGDGSIFYCGDGWVEHLGTRASKIDKSEVSDLYNEIVSLNFFEFDDEYHAYAMDLPIYRVQISFDGYSKTVVDEAGSMVGMPIAVTKVQDAIDEAAGTREWVGTFTTHDRSQVTRRCENRLD